MPEWLDEQLNERFEEVTRGLEEGGIHVRGGFGGVTGPDRIHVSVDVQFTDYAWTHSRNPYVDQEGIAEIEMSRAQHEIDLEAFRDELREFADQTDEEEE